MHKSNKFYTILAERVVYMAEQNSDQIYPVSEYYEKGIMDAHTISKAGSWWTALVLIEDPRSKSPFISLYRWQKTANGWKVRKQFKFKSKTECKKILQSICEMAEELPD